ncbi:hypothetical protein EA462_11570 [Natrarchaeobius halalkaliphilus]|uniref:Uncharacterized protein n=1 Tax=Natrarchaeobius halalkaliphilus TaxID=1679091 RepID=A0A3N6NX86_9EURY|nr:hypothetical protein [Natrarchaeobius halalkaliphilus]RQG89279.1 hypothetical protein EA462_11570 [Natrarchaeobius halalkaliphilus]
MGTGLDRAHTELERAAETASDDVREDVQVVLSAFEEYEIEDRLPDHAVFDGHLNTLRQASERASGETRERIDDGLEAAEAFREELEQG